MNITDDMTFNVAFIKVMQDEFACSLERCNHLLTLINDEIVNHNKIENKILRYIKSILNEGKVFNEMGGFGDSDFSLYFKDNNGRRGFVPSRFFKDTSIADSKVEKMKRNWGAMLIETCDRCNKLAANVDVEISKQSGNRTIRDIYDLIYCESCNRVFIKNYRQV